MFCWQAFRPPDLNAITIEDYLAYSDPMRRFAAC